MEDVRLSKLRASLVDALSNWWDENSDGDGGDALDTYLSDFTFELMADSAFNILLAQSDLTAYFKINQMIANP